MLANLRCILLGKCLDELVCMCQSGCLLYLGYACLWACKADIDCQTFLEEVGVLRHPRQAVDPCLLGNIGQINAIHENAAGLWLYEAQEQGKNRAFACSALPCQHS